MSFRKRMLRHGPRTGVLAASIGALIATGGVTTKVFAQDDDDDDEDQVQTADDVIVVTGTRIRRDDFNAPNATTVVTGDDMQQLGVISVADMVNQLPNNVASVSPEANADSAFNVGASIANLRGLNTFFGTRTLTMVDSRRMVATNNGGGVDLNFIPSALVGRIETVTGGGGATYGADAMAGVVNVILDTNIDTMKVQAGYQTTNEGDGSRYNVSFATGTDLLDGRGHFTVSLDYSNQDAIEDCTSRAYCAEARGILRNGNGVGTGFFGLGPPAPYSNRNNVVFQGEPQWLILNDMHQTILTEGMLFADGFTTGEGCDDFTVDPLLCGSYRFTPDGTNIVPYLDPTPENPITLAQRESLANEGTNGVTPWGDGKSPYAAVPLLPETKRGNIFTRFAYELEGGIELQFDLQYGQTKNRVLQKQTRDNIQSFCIRNDNAFLVQSGQLMQDVFAARYTTGTFTPTNVGGFNDWAIQCDEPPFMGGSFFDDREDGRFDFGPGTVMFKDMSEHLDRENNNKTDVTQLTVNANGDLFEGGTWTWDGTYSYGKTETNTFIKNWRSDNRLQMAVDSVIDPVTGETVCRTDSSPGDPTNGIVDGREYVKWEFFPPPFGTDTMPSNTRGDGSDIWDKWHTFYTVALKEEFTPATIDQEAWDWFHTIRQGCTPFNPFGSPEQVPIPDGALAFAFPSIVESTDIEQHLINFNFSGELHQGIGAGPLLMAAGIDWRREETYNHTGDDPISARDFQSNFAGVNAFGDDWAGRTENSEAYAELEMPFLRDKPGADTLTVNISKRFTQVKSTPLQVRNIVTAEPNENQVDSWKATMVWKPVELMTVRITRSSDTRAPSSRELFQTNTGAQQAGGQNELISPFKVDVPGTQQSEAADQYENISGGNARLQPETSITETLGLVFAPVETLPGLQVSVDYYETHVSGGIETVSAQGTLNRCAANEIGAELPPDQWVFCRNIQFGPPDPQQSAILAAYGCDYNDDPANGPVILTGCTPAQIDRILPYTNIEAIASSQVNVSPYFNRGVDFSMNYNRQLSGGGFIYVRGLVTRFLEQRVDLVGNNNPADFANVAGQTGSNGLTRQNGSFGINFSPTPRIRGNAFMSYNKNAITIGGQMLYTGAGRLNIQDGWIGPGESTSYIDGMGVEQIAYYDPAIIDTVSKGALPSWTTFNLNFSYDFSRSRFDFDRFEALTASLNIQNVGNKIPGFFSGRGAGGLNTTYFSGLGRQYNLSLTMEF